MNIKLTFKERSEIAFEMLKKQGPVTLEEAREQVKRVKENSLNKK